MPAHIDLTGLSFGRLTVLREEFPRQPSGTRWLCQCECGSTKVAGTRKLRSGRTLSCGCKSREWVASFGGRFVDRAVAALTKHGHASGGARTSEYDSWVSMKQRCTNPADKAFARYGARGIKVCARWMESFATFLGDMGPKPTPAHTIDRLRHRGDYEPGNCRWATKAQQGQENKGTLIPLEYRGVMYPSIRAACRAAGVSHHAVYYRMKVGVPVGRLFDGLTKG